MKSEAGTEIDVVAMNGRGAVLFRSLRLPSGICPDQGETVLGRCDAARGGPRWTTRVSRVNTPQEFSR
jgi:hypothetical protein